MHEEDTDLDFAADVELENLFDADDDVATALEGLQVQLDELRALDGELGATARRVPQLAPIVPQLRSRRAKTAAASKSVAKAAAKMKAAAAKRAKLKSTCGHLIRPINSKPLTPSMVQNMTAFDQGRVFVRLRLAGGATVAENLATITGADGFFRLFHRGRTDQGNVYGWGAAQLTRTHTNLAQGGKLPSNMALVATGFEVQVWREDKVAISDADLIALGSWDVDVGDGSGTNMLNLGHVMDFPPATRLAGAGGNGAALTGMTWTGRPFKTKKPYITLTPGEGDAQVHLRPDAPTYAIANALIVQVSMTGTVYRGAGAVN
ncbi:MAG: hypothetical protein R3F65_23645 [bacterium]